jgi:hypothetical protein
MTGQAIVYPRDEIRSIRVRGRILRNQIRIQLTSGEELCFEIYARRATDQYRTLLRRTYEPIYSEEGFGAWWAPKFW